MTRAAVKRKPAAAKPRAAKSKPVAFVYVLGCCHKGRWLSYVGWTNDVARRVDKHNAGTGARTTRGRAWTLLHTEAFKTRVEAMSREWHLKRDRAFRKKLMDGLRAGRREFSPLPVLTGEVGLRSNLGEGRFRKML